MTPATAPVTVVTISGHRQGAVTDSPNFHSWQALADQLGDAWCLWAGPDLRTHRGALHVVRRPRRPGPPSVAWVVRQVHAGTRITRSAGRRGETVVLNGGEPWGWLAAWMVSRLTGRPWLMDMHADYLALPAASVGRWRAIALGRAVLFFARRASARRVVARSMLDQFARRGVAADLVPPRLLPIWQEPIERERAPLSGTGPSLLVVGRLVRSKGYDLLLEAVADLVRSLPSVRLRIVGDGPERAALTGIARRLGLSDRVDFLGAAGVEAVRAELGRADLFVISSRDEGLPRTLLEAVAAGVPVVATPVGGIPAAVRDWPTVSLTTADPRALAARIRAVVERPPTSDQLAAVRDAVLTSYGFDHNIAALCELYRTTAGRKAR